MADDFDAWLEEASVSTKTSKIWDSWPDEARSEIEKIIAINDSGRGVYITVGKVLQRLEAAYGIQTSANTMARYARIVLGRTSWKTK